MSEAGRPFELRNAWVSALILMVRRVKWRKRVWGPLAGVRAAQPSIVTCRYLPAGKQHHLAFTAFAPDQRRSSSSSPSRPTSAVRPVVQRLETASTELARSAAQPRTPTQRYPLRFCSPRSPSSNRLPTSLRVFFSYYHAVRLPAPASVPRWAYRRRWLALRSTRPDQIADYQSCRYPTGLKGGGSLDRVL
jgi:hypothetical protein